MLDAVRGLMWPARHVVAAGLPGTHQSRVRGPAPEFSEYRAFRPGDDPRRLDWRLLARTDRAFLRLADDRAVQGTLLVLDASASMAFPDTERSKWRVAARLAVGLAQVAHQSGDPVGLLVAGPAGVTVTPRTRRGVVNEIAAALAWVTPQGAGRLGDALLRRALPSRVVILSDFLDDDPVLLRAVTTRVLRGGEVTAVQVVADEELVPRDTTFTAVDPEAPNLTRPFSPAGRAEYRRRFDAWRVALAGRWRASGAQWREIITDEPAGHAIRRIVREPA